MNGLTAGWAISRLGDLADTSLGKMLDAARPKGSSPVPYLRNLNVQWGRIELEDLQTVPLSEDEIQRFALEPGDLLVCEGGDIGRAALWTGQREHMAYQKALHRVRSRGELDLIYLRYLLEHYRNQGVLRAHATGSTILHLPQRQLRELPISHPPIREQRRIVEILEDHLSRLDAASVAVSAAAIRAAAWERSITDRMVWRASHEWPLVPVATLIREKMRNGHSARASKSGVGVRTLTLTAVTRHSFTDEFTKIVAVDETRVADLWLEPGDLLVQRSNTPELVGTTALYEGPSEWAIFPDLMIRLRVDPVRVSPRYLALALRSERAHRWLRSRAKGLAGSMPKIDQTTIGALEVPLPPMTEQDRVCEIAAKVDETCQGVRAQERRTSRRAASLRQSLLAAAFSGRLTADAPVAS